MTDADRPQDRIHRARPKPPTRLVQMKLPLDLVDAIEVMAEVHVRKFHSMIDVCLKWAVWAHSHGRDPYAEMMSAGGFVGWNDNLDASMDPVLKELAREWADMWDARLEARKLERLYELGEDESGGGK